MDFSLAGGGFFYSKFSKCFAVPAITLDTVDFIFDDYGLWKSVPAPESPYIDIPGRYFQLDIFAIGAGGYYNVQMATGEAGSEQLFMPTDGSGFGIDNSLVGVIAAAKQPFSFNFIGTLPRNSRPSFRAKLQAGTGHLITCKLYVWN